MNSRTKRNRSVAAVALIVAVGLGLAACSSSAPDGSPTASAKYLSQDAVVASAPVAKNLPASPTISKIKKEGYLTFGGAPSAPLFSQLNPVTNEYDGFDAGLAYSFAKYVTGKPNIKFVSVNSTNREALLENGTVDFVANGYAINLKRAQLVNFAGPYLLTGDGIVVAKSNPSIKGVNDLNGKTIATNPGVGVADVQAAAPKANIITFADNTQLENAVMQGRADAMVLNLPNLLGAVYQHPEQLKLVSDKPFTTLNMGIGLPKSDPELKKIVNAWLDKIEKSGYYAQLWKATVGKYAPVPTPPAIGSAPGS